MNLKVIAVPSFTLGILINIESERNGRSGSLSKGMQMESVSPLYFTTKFLALTSENQRPASILFFPAYICTESILPK